MRTLIGLFAVVVAFFVLVVGILAGLMYLHDRAENQADPRIVASSDTANFPPEVRPSVIAPIPSAPTLAEKAEFGILFDHLGQALARRDEAACTAIFNSDRVAQELDSLGAFANLPGGDTPANRIDFILGARSQLGRALLRNELLRWERTDVRWIHRSIEGNEVKVVAYHRSAILNNRAHKIRWSLIKGPDGWKVFDFEDLEMGISMTRGIGSVLTPEAVRELRRDPRKFQQAMESFREAIAAVVIRQDADEAEDKLKSIGTISLPKPMAAMREIIEGAILMQRGAPEAALKRFDAAERIQPGMPLLNRLRASVSAAAGRYAEALPLIEKYLTEVGPDPDALAIKGYTLEGLDRYSEAKAAYHRALDEMPELPEALEGLRRVLAKGEKGQLVNRIAKAPNPLKIYDIVHWSARSDNDFETLDALKTWLKKDFPNDARCIYLELTDLLDNGEYEAAASALRKRLGSDLKDDLKQSALNTFVVGMLDAESPLDGYSAVPASHAAAAFRTLIDEIDEREFIPLPLNPNDPTVKALRELNRRHRARQPNDPWLFYSEATVLRHEQRLAEAERTFAAGQAKLPKPPKNEKPKADEPDRDWDASRFRSARVECLISLGDGMRAYKEIGPAAETFGQVAHAYDTAKDIQRLEALMAAHRKNEPNDRQLAYWSAELLVLRGRPVEAADAFRAFLVGAKKNEPNRWRAVDQCVRGYLHANLPGKAESAVEDIGVDSIQPALRAAVHMANGHVAQAEEVLAAQTGKGGGYLYFYYDEDFAKQMQRPENAPLRKKYPDTRKASMSGEPG